MSKIFPHDPFFNIAGKRYHYQDILQAFDSRLTVSRKEKMQQVIKSRTYMVTPVLENVDDQGNMNGLIRTAEGLGFQSIHLIAGGKIQRYKSITQGADKWLDVHKWDQSAQCIDYLKQEGRKIYISLLSDRAKKVEDLDFTQPCAIVLGNEKDGVSPVMHSMADECFALPMTGFSQSFNVSVAGAMILYQAYLQRKSYHNNQDDLNEEEQSILKALYYIRHIKEHAQVLEWFFSQRSGQLQ